jgi:hypothetical protein
MARSISMREAIVIVIRLILVLGGLVAIERMGTWNN